MFITEFTKFNCNISFWAGNSQWLILPSSEICLTLDYSKFMLPLEVFSPNVLHLYSSTYMFVLHHTFLNDPDNNKRQVKNFNLPFLNCFYSSVTSCILPSAPCFTAPHHKLMLFHSTEKPNFPPTQRNRQCYISIYAEVCKRNSWS